jgi:hypothetical protein
MPLAGSEAILGAQMYSMVVAELGKLPNPESAAQLQKLCNGLAKAIVPHIVSMTQVAPGIVTAGSPSAQVTTTPGTLL